MPFVPLKKAAAAAVAVMIVVAWQEIAVAQEAWNSLWNQDEPAVFQYKGGQQHKTEILKYRGR